MQVGPSLASLASHLGPTSLWAGQMEYLVWMVLIVLPEPMAHLWPSAVRGQLQRPFSKKHRKGQNSELTSGSCCLL